MFPFFLSSWITRGFIYSACSPSSSSLSSGISWGWGDRRGEGGTDMGLSIFLSEWLKSSESTKANISGKARSNASFLALTYSAPMVSQSKSSLRRSVLFLRVIL